MLIYIYFIIFYALLMIHFILQVIL